MTQEITHLSQRFLQLKKKYEMSRCTPCLAMQEWLRREYQKLITKLQSLERLVVNNNTASKTLLKEAHQVAGVVGMYVMV